MTARLSILPAVAQAALPEEPALIQGWAVVLLVILAIAVFAVIRAVTRARRRRMNEDNPTASALQMLDERLARGEIRREEYEERKRAILTMAGPTGNL